MLPLSGLLDSIEFVLIGEGAVIELFKLLMAIKKGLGKLIALPFS